MKLEEAIRRNFRVSEENIKMIKDSLVYLVQLKARGLKKSRSVIREQIIKQLEEGRTDYNQIKRSIK